MGIESSSPRETTVNDNVSLPKWFWIISIIALLWYFMDMSAFIMRVFMADEALFAMPENQQLHFQNIPLWVNIVFAFEVFGGLFGCIGLLLRKKWALPLFIVSIFGVLGQTSYIYFLSDSIALVGTQAVVMPLVAIIISVGLIVFANASIDKKWLR